MKYMKIFFILLIIILFSSGCSVFVEGIARGITGDRIKIELGGNQNEAEISFYEIDRETEERYNEEQLFELKNTMLENNKEKISLPYTEDRILNCCGAKLFIQIRLLSKQGSLNMKIWKNNKLIKVRKLEMNCFNSPYRMSVD